MVVCMSRTRPVGALCPVGCVRFQVARMRRRATMTMRPRLCHADKLGRIGGYGRNRRSSIDVSSRRGSVLGRLPVFRHPDRQLSVHLRCTPKSR